MNKEYYLNTCIVKTKLRKNGVVREKNEIENVI